VKLFFNILRVHRRRVNVARVSVFRPVRDNQAVAMVEMCLHGIRGDFNDVSVTVACAMEHFDFVIGAQVQRLIGYAANYDCGSDSEREYFLHKSISFLPVLLARPSSHMSGQGLGR